MLAEVKIKLTTNFLGGGQRKNGIRTIKRTSENQVAINEQEWLSDFSEVAASLGIVFDPKSVKLECGFDATTRTLRRTYNKVNVEMFEGIPAGTRLSLFIYIDQRHDNCLDIKQLHQIMIVIGKFFGISQFGKKFHCGRFKVHDIVDVRKE